MYVIYDVYLMQSQHILASRDWERERASLNEYFRQLELELGAFCMDPDSEDSDEGDT